MFEELDVAGDIAGQFSGSLTTCSDVHQVQTSIPSLSDVCLSHVCVPDEYQQSSDGHLLSRTTMSSAEGNHTTTTITTSQSTVDKVKSDYDVCVEFVERTCGCKKADGKPCSSLFPLEHFAEMRSQAFLMTHQELDLVLLGSLMTTLHDHEDTVARGRHKPVKRKKITSHFMHNGYHVCINTFAFLYGIGANHRIKAIRKHYLENGMEPRVHKNTKRLPPRTASYEDILVLVKFLQNYAETNAILLPGRIPGYKRDDLKLLPSSTSKKVWLR